MSINRLLGSAWLRHDEPMKSLYGVSDAVESQIWFKSEPLTMEFCQRVVQLQLCTDSRDQGFASDKSQGSWSWFELVILPNASTDVPKRTKDGYEMAYKSHGNQLAHDERTMHYGLMFDRRSRLLANIEPGDVIAVRACVRFAAWENHGERAFITTRMLKEDLFPTDLWTLDSEKAVQHESDIMDCAYQYSAPTGCLVRAPDANIHSKIWFATPAFDDDMINRLESLQLFARARHQRAEGESYRSLPEKETFSWFDIVILKSPTDTTPKVVNGVSMVWRSHKNTRNEFNQDDTAGQLFDESSLQHVPTVKDILRELGQPEDTDVSQLPEDMQAMIHEFTNPQPSQDMWEKRSGEIKLIKAALKPGNAIGVRVCAQFAGWEAYAETGFLVVRVSNLSRPAPDIRIPDYSESNDQAQQIKKAVQKFQDNIVTPEGVRITVESVDVTMLDNEVRADQVVKTAPPPYSEVEQRPLRILSLDGGGVRGVSELIILKKIMNSLPKVPKEPTKEDPSTERAPHPYEVFDMMAGTSTGGLIALMLGRLKMSIEECEVAYDTVSKAIFEHGKPISAEAAFATGFLIYSPKPLVEQVRGLVKKHLHSADGNDKLVHDDEHACKVFVVTCLANSPTAQNFVKLRSYHPPTATDESTFPNFTIWEAARATSAAPAYFERLKVKDELTGNEHHFIDGGMVYNNPTPLVITEIAKVFGPRPIGCLLSLGTGVPLNVKYGEGALPTAAAGLISLLTNTENAHATSRDTASLLPIPGPWQGKYMRLNLSKALSDDAQVNLPKKFVEQRKKIWKIPNPFAGTELVEVKEKDFTEMMKDMADWKGIDRIRKLTEAWLDLAEEETIQSCVTMLSQSVASKHA